MGHVFYNFIIFLYYLTLRIYSLFNQRANQWFAVRKTQEAVKRKLPNQKRIWLHASSVGEYEQGLPLLRLIKDSHPEISIVVTFYSPSASLIAIDGNVVNHTVFMPVDLRSKAKSFVEFIDPDLVIFVKYDFWINHLQACFEKPIPVFFISVRFRKNQLYFNFALNFYIPYFRQVTHFFVQDQQSANLLIKNGCGAVTVCGDTRIDRVIKIANQKHQLPLIENFLGKDECIVIGSCWDSDFNKLLPFIRQNINRWKWIIVPHNPHDQKFIERITGLGNHCMYDQLNPQNPELVKKRILIVNRMGFLSNIYQYAKVAIVGGAFRGTLHNILEPAVFGVPILFGRHINNQKFAEAQALIECGGAFHFKNSEELKSIFIEVIHEPVRYREAAQASFDYVRSGKGATQSIFTKIYTYLNP